VAGSKIGRLFTLAEEGTTIIQRAMRSQHEGKQLAGARMALAAATRALARYKEHRVEGYDPPPLFILPPGTRMKTLREIPPLRPEIGPGAPVIGVEGGPVDEPS
jgi:hypothetical protein